MKWLLKCAAFRALSAIPYGSRIHLFAQRHITKSIVPTAERVWGKLEVARRYWSFLQEVSFNAREAVHVDFGSGWNPTIPLFFYSQGCNQQYLFDLEPVMDRQTVAQTIDLFRKVLSEREVENQRLPARSAPGEQLEDIFQRLGMKYLAPYGDALSQMRATADLVTSTQVLLHIDSDTLKRCFSMIFDALKAGGYFMGTIHLRTLFGGLDNQPYNSLRYSPSVWQNVVNSKITSYNRLKARDYKELLENAGFELTRFEVDPVTDEDLAELAKIQVHPAFSTYSREELAAKHVFFVARKPS